MAFLRREIIYFNYLNSEFFFCFFYGSRVTHLTTPRSAPVSKLSPSEDSKTKTNGRQYTYKIKPNQPEVQNENFPIKVRVTARRYGVLGSLPTVGQSHFAPVWNARLGAIPRTSDTRRFVSHHVTSQIPTTHSARNHHSLISIKRQVTVSSHGPVTSTRTLPNVMVLNARSIFNKVDELKAYIEIYKPDIIFVTETWLSENIPNEAIHIDDFTGENAVKDISRYGLSYDVVMELMEPYLGQVYHIYFDNFYASPQLVKDHFSKGTLSVSTVKPNRKDFPESSLM